MKLSELTALYSELDWQYSQAMSGPYEDLRNKSEDGDTVAGLKDGRISGAWRPMVCIGSDKWQKSEILRLWRYSDNIYYMDFLINGQLSEVSKFLLREGYKARPVYTQIIDRTLPIHILHNHIRKSYKSLINKYENVEYGGIDDYFIAHEKYGGHTRPYITWLIQASMIEKEEAFILMDGSDAAVLIYCNGYSAYYAGGRSSPDKNTHALLWQAIIRAECNIFELGEQVFYGDEKLINISTYKRGFGGETQTRLILEKSKCQ